MADWSTLDLLPPNPRASGSGKGKQSAEQKFDVLKSAAGSAEVNMQPETAAQLQDLKQESETPIPGANLRYDQALQETVTPTGGFGAAVEESIPVQAYRGLTSKYEAEDDPNFDYREYMAEYENKIRPEYADYMRGAKSKPDLDYRLSKIQEHMKNDATQANDPWGAFIGGTVSDPLTFLAVPEAKLATGIAKAVGAGRAASVGIGVGSATMTSLINEGVRQGLQGKEDPMGYVYAGAFTAGLVGMGMGAEALLARRVQFPETNAFDSSAADQGARLAAAAAESGDVPATALKPFDMQHSPKPQYRYNNETGQWDLMPPKEQGFGEDTAGAARAAQEQLPETQFDTSKSQDEWRRQFHDIADQVEADKTSQTQWQQWIDKTSQAFGITADSIRFWKSESKTLRGLSTALFENPLFGGKYINQTAAVMQDMRKRQFQAGMLEMNDQYALWAKNEKVGKFSPDEILNTARARFDSELRQELEYRWKGRAMDDKTYQQHLAGSKAKPEIKAAADAWDKVNQSILDDARNAGVRGFDAHEVDLPEFSRGYVHRQVDGQMLRKMFHQNKAQYDKYKKAMSQAIYEDLQLWRLTDKSGKRLEPPKAKRLAAAYADSTFEIAMKKGYDTSGLFGTLTTDMRAEIQAALKKSGATYDDIDALFRSFDEQAADAGRTKYAKHRMELDLYKDRNGTRLIDLYDNDLSRLSGSYGEEMAGRTALAKYGITSDADIQDLRQVMMAEGATPAEVQSFDDSLHMLMGKRINGQGNRNIRRLKEFTRLTTLNATGWFAQVAETANATAQLGLSATIKALPAFRATYNKIRSGQADRTVLKELSRYMGPIGEDHLLMFPNIRLTDVNAADPVVLQQLDAVLAKGLHFQQYINGMQQVHGGQRRIVVEGMMQRLWLATEGRAAISDARLAEIGLKPDQLAALRTHLRQYGKVENDRLVEIGLEHMDPYQRDELVAALHRSASQMIQGNFVGESAAWMSTDLGSILTQLRTFPLVALQKQMLRGLYHADTTAFSAVAGGMGLAAVVYMAQQQVNAFGRENREELLAQRLSPDNIIKGAVQRMSMSSLLPEAFTIGAAFGVLPPEASFGNIGRTGEWRSQTLGASDIIPAFGPVEKAANSIGALSSAAGMWGADKQMSASDYRNIFGVIPYGNNPLAIWLSNQLGLQDEQ